MVHRRAPQVFVELDGLDISIEEFFRSELFRGLEQEIK
jgi:hypothetical protein